MTSSNTNTEEPVSDQLTRMLIYDEGFRERLYKDTEGFNTIGIGFCLDRIEMPIEVAKFWLILILADIEEQLETYDDLNTTYQALDIIRKLAILNMCYQLGVSGCGGFRNMWAALKEGDYDTAAREAALSDWARQTPTRAKRIASVIKSGTLDAYNR